MAGDNLFAVLCEISHEGRVPGISDHTWELLKAELCAKIGGTRTYTPARIKRSNLATVAAASAETSVQQLAKLLGVSVRRVQQLKKLKG